MQMSGGHLQITNGIAIIVKLTNSCNFSCTYCGVSGFPIRKKGLTIETMSIEQIIQLFNVVCNSKKVSSVDFIWHGGEPLLMGPNFFKKVIKNQNKIFKDVNIKVENSIQTNGALINEKWIKFFKQNKFGLGISIDGDKELQSKQKKALSGNSYNQTIKGIKSLQKNLIPFGTLAVLTKDSIQIGAKNLFNFFINKGIKTFDFLPQEPILDINGNQLSENIYPTKEYVIFANELFDIWYELDDPKIHILLFEEIIRSLLNKGSKICQIGHGICANTIFTFYPNNTITQCDKFPRASNTIKKEEISNITKINSIDEVCLSSTYSKVLNQQIKTLKWCGGCKYYNNCKGGCTFDRYLSSKYNLNNSQCSIFKIFEHIQNRIKENINR